MIGFDQVEYGYGNPNTWSQVIFEVADPQVPTGITLPSLTISCIHPNRQEFQETIGPIHLGLDKDLHQLTYPTSRPDSDLSSITQPFTISNQGELRLQDIQVEAGMLGIKYLVMNFKYTNTSADSDNRTRISAFLLGNDGLARRHTYVYGPKGCSSTGTLSANSRQSSEVRLCFQVGNQAADFKFLWIDDEPDLLQVYDLPDGF